MESNYLNSKNSLQVCKKIKPFLVLKNMMGSCLPYIGNNYSALIDKFILNKIYQMLYFHMSEEMLAIKVSVIQSIPPCWLLSVNKYLTAKTDATKMSWNL